MSPENGQNFHKTPKIPIKCLKFPVFRPEVMLAYSAWPWIKELAQVVKLLDHERKGTINESEFASGLMMLKVRPGG
jgi:hypothetical protein